jgi:hypothetical protein
VREPESPSRLTCVGEHEFHPAGAPRVRVVFELRDGRAAVLRILEQDLSVEARRVA